MGKLAPLWETEHWLVILSEDQTYLGRGVISLKRRPCTTLTELRDEELVDLRNNVIVPYEAAVKKAFGAELFNWACLMNNAYQNTPPDPHVHWHVWPRYRNPVELEGEAFVDEYFGHYLSLDKKRSVSPELRRMIEGRILASKD
jgi:diadenosine tetraphosphate (Ap4A) HIT family hydrolase